MRSSIKLIAALLIVTASSRAFAQYQDVDPRTLPAQVTAQEKIVQTEPASNDWQAWLKLAVLLEDASSYRESEDAYRHTITLLRDPAPLVVADVFDHMGTMYIASGRLSKAEPVERQALAIRENQNDKLGAGVSHMHLAMLLLGQNDLRSAQAEAQSAVSLLMSVTSRATPEEKMTALIDLSVIQCASGASQEALPTLQHALEIAHESYQEKSVPVGYIDFLLGYANWKSGNIKGGGELMSQAIDTLRVDLGWGHPKYLEVLRQYKAFLVDIERPDKANQISAELERLAGSRNSFAVASEKASTVQNPPR